MKIETAQKENLAPDALSIEPEILFSTLTGLETFILEALLIKSRPISVGEISTHVDTAIWITHLREFPRTSLSELVMQDVTTKKFNLQRMPFTKEIAEIRNQLKKEDIKYPSYRKIESSIKTLESWGFIIKREEGKGKAKAGLWILSPRLSVERRFELKSYLKAIEVEITW